MKRIHWLLAAFVLSMCFSATTWGNASLQSFTVTTSPATNSLFLTVGVLKAPNRQYVDSVWSVTVNFALLSTLPPSVDLNFPDRPAVTLTRMRFQRRGSGFLWTGRGADCFALFTDGPGGFDAQIACLKSNYGVRMAPDTSGLELVRGIVPSATDEMANDIAGAPAGPGIAPSAPQGAVTTAQTDTAIDILILYTEAVRQAQDGATGNVRTKARAQEAVDLIQSILDNSTPGYPDTTSVPIATVNFVAAQEVQRTQTGSFPNDLLYLTGNSEPVGMRNFWAADVVIYLTVAGTVGYSGQANQPDYQGYQPPGAAFAPNAVAALQYNCALALIDNGPACLDNYVFPHEFAHTIGANHDIGNSPWPGGPPYPTTVGSMPVTTYAFGHWANNPGGAGEGGNRTVMSYPAQCNSPCPRIPYYSNSQVYAGAWRTGVAGQENAPVIQEFAPATAQYRASLGRLFYNGFESGQ